MSVHCRPRKAYLLPCTLVGALAAFCVLMPAAGAQQQPTKTTRTVVLENELVRVVEVRAEPGSQIEMREQPDQMVIVLEAAPAKNTQPSRRTEWAQGKTKPDTGIYKPAEGPAAGSVLNAARAIVVEFKQQAPQAGRAPSLPPPYKQVSENAHAVQFEATAAPGQVTPLHTHGNHVLIALADGTVELTDPSGKKEKLELKKDTVKFGPPITHTSANTGSTPLHWILIELK